MGEVCNAGIAFGIMLPPMVLWGVIAAAFVCVGYGIFLSIRRRLWMGFVGGVVCLTGAAWNAWERWVYGCVHDFLAPLDFFPTFNIADVLIVLGACVMIVVWTKAEY